MLPEALVIFACLNSTGCTETSDQYFVLHPEVKHYLDREGQDIRQYIGPRFVDTIGPALYVVAGGTGTIHLVRYLNLQVRKDSAMLSFRLDF